MTKRILLVEDTNFFGKMVIKQLAHKTAYAIDWAKSKDEALTLLGDPEVEYCVGIIDFILPDAPRGEMVQECVSRGIPTIVFTGVVNDEIRDQVWAMNVVDYISKEDDHSLEQLGYLIERLEHNARTKILVVDDAPLIRDNLSALLRIHRYDVACATNGGEALQMLAEDSSFRMVITDFDMPEMNGVELTCAIRKRFPKDQLAIIALSAKGANLMAARFLKAGANDFVVKQTFLREEFYYRVAQNIANLENIHAIREASIRDDLTGLYNRRYFFTEGQAFWEKARRENKAVCCALIDIDNFKQINDEVGHSAGDEILKSLAEQIRDFGGESTLSVRLGGDEFAMLAVRDNNEVFRYLFETLRHKVESNPVRFASVLMRVTLSIGVYEGPAASFDEMLQMTDQLLSRAKDNGCNRVEISLA